MSAIRVTSSQFSRLKKYRLGAVPNCKSSRKPGIIFMVGVSPGRLTFPITNVACCSSSIWFNEWSIFKQMITKIRLINDCGLSFLLRSMFCLIFSFYTVGRCYLFCLAFVHSMPSFNVMNDKSHCDLQLNHFHSILFLLVLLHTFASLSWFYSFYSCYFPSQLSNDEWHWYLFCTLSVKWRQSPFNVLHVQHCCPEQDC